MDPKSRVFRGANTESFVIFAYIVIQSQCNRETNGQTDASTRYRNTCCRA